MTRLPILFPGYGPHTRSSRGKARYRRTNRCRVSRSTSRRAGSRQRRRDSSRVLRDPARRCYLSSYKRMGQQTGPCSLGEPRFSDGRAGRWNNSGRRGVSPTWPTAKPPSAGDPCFLCAGLAADDDRKHLIALRTPLSVVVLNRFPYNNGHLLIAPRQHKGRLDELDLARNCWRRWRRCGAWWACSTS